MFSPYSSGESGLVPQGEALQVGVIFGEHVDELEIPNGNSSQLSGRKIPFSVVFRAFIHEDSTFAGNRGPVDVDLDFHRLLTFTEPRIFVERSLSGEFVTIHWDASPLEHAVPYLRIANLTPWDLELTFGRISDSLERNSISSHMSLLGTNDDLHVLRGGKVVFSLTKKMLSAIKQGEARNVVYFLIPPVNRGSTELQYRILEDFGPADMGMTGRNFAKEDGH